MKAKLKDLGKISTGNTPSKNTSEFYNSEDIGFVKPDIISELQIDYIENTTEYLAEAARNKARIVKKNAVCVTCIGSIGKIGIVKSKELAFNQQINAIEPNEKVLPKYLAYGIFANKRRLQAISNAPVVPIINKTQFGEFEIDITDDTKEQLKIVKLLDKVSEVIAKHKEELEKLDELIKVRFIEMFGDPVVNEKGWLTKSLLDMGQCKNGMNFHYDDEGVEINCLGVGDFRDLSIIDNTDKLPIVSLNEMPSEEYLLKDNDIVFVRSNGNKALVGRSIAVYPGDVPTTFSGFCIRYRKHDKEITVPYLLRVLKADSMRGKMTGRGVNIQNLNQQILGTLVIPVPPMELQEQFADFVKQVDKSKVTIQKALDETKLLFNSLMQKYFG